MPKAKGKVVKVTKGETLVNFILDKSGSMDSVKGATITGFNEYLNTLKKDGNKYSFSLTLFDTDIKSPYVNQPISEVKDFNSETYIPNGMTALYDAVCGTIKNVKERKGQKVINIIMTDGEENSSKEYSEKEMKALIKEREKKGNWSFVYLGANQDSYANAQKFGISQMNVSNYSSTDQGTRSAMVMMATNTSSFAAASAANTSNFFSANDQVNLASGTLGMATGTAQSAGVVSSATTADPISAHFSKLGKKSWEKRKKGLQGGVN